MGVIFTFRRWYTYMKYYWRQTLLLGEIISSPAAIKYHTRMQVFTRGNKIGIAMAPESMRSTSAWWRHQMETSSALLAIYVGNSPVLVNSPHKGQWHAALMFSLICGWINGWVNSREAGDLKRRRAHYDVIVMPTCYRMMPWIVYMVGTRTGHHKPKQYHWYALCKITKRFDYRNVCCERTKFCKISV